VIGGGKGSKRGNGEGRRKKGWKRRRGNSKQEGRGRLFQRRGLVKGVNRIEGLVLWPSGTDLFLSRIETLRKGPALVDEKKFQKTKGGTRHKTKWRDWPKRVIYF